MANVIKHKRGSGSDPGASDLILGELAIRTDTGKLFTKMDSGAIAEIAGGGSDIAINTLSSSSGTGGGSATFNGSAYRFTLSAPPNVSAAQLLVSINGVIQKPVAGTGQPSEGFSVDGTDIILGDAPAAGSDFFILTFKSLGVSEPADNSVTSAKIVDGAIVNADINASAAIARTKLANVDLVDDTSPQLGNSLDMNGQSINGGDSAGVANNRIKLGAGDDLQIFHDGSNSHVTSGAGQFFLSSSNSNIWLRGTEAGLLNTNGSQYMIRATSNGSVKLFHANSQKFETTSIGASLTGRLGCDGLDMGDSETIRLGSSQDFQISHDGTSSLIKSIAHPIAHYSNTRHHFLNADGSENVAVLVPEGQCEFYHNGSKRLETTTEGVSISGSLTGNAIENATLRFNILNSSGAEKKAQIISTKVADISSTIEFGTTVSHSYAERMRIHSDGNVGIGTAAPARRLHVHDDSSDSIYLAVTNSTTGTSSSDGVLFGFNSGEQAIIWNFENTALKFATNGTERALIKNDGRVAINTDILANGADEYGGFVSMKPYHNFDNNASNLATSATQSTLRVRTSSNSSMSLYIGGLDDSIDSARPYLQVGNLSGAAGATAFYDLYLCPFGGIVRTRQVMPKDDDSYDLGSSANRWDDIFATNDTIQTSDRNEKNTIVDSDLGLSFINKLKPVSYKFNGKTRTHYGLIAQDIETVLSDISKSTTDFAGFIKSVVSDVLYTEDEPLPDDKKVGDVKTPGSTNYGLRYAEFIAPLIKAVQELSAKVEALEAK